MLLDYASITEKFTKTKKNQIYFFFLMSHTELESVKASELSLADGTTVKADLFNEEQLRNEPSLI